LQVFEITPDHIASLNDEDLRKLVGLLCEAEVRSKGSSTSFVTWGGDQNAKDGGIDVRVALPESVDIRGFIPRPQAGFQVKKSDMNRVRILAEMRPNGTLRPAICELANCSGSYVIVSGESSASDLALQGRRDAMKEAVRDIPNAAALGLDFYDRGRLATWVRGHTGLVLWVRERIGRSLRGWRPYEAWAYAAGGVEAEYLLDSKLRIRSRAAAQEDGFPPLDGINVIREKLRNPSAVVRLIGLSGVGKTRLVQALFDSRVGTDSLDPSLAAYTNIGDGHDPQPFALVSDLIATRTKAIVVVDNCPPELHRSLSDLCRTPQGSVSLITVEYDIREDQPEGTEIFELEPSSADLIEKLVEHRFPHISQVDSRTIAEFSDGNARIAVALAETIDQHESIAGISDEHLFRRLFYQRHEPNESLLKAGQVLSLVYSFQGEDVSDGEKSELSRLGALIGKNANELFRSAAELERRRLIQRRGVWRAVLPQAIANRLAALALQDIPASTIDARLLDGAPERLIKSFSRRLGYLHSSPEAQAMAQRWLGAEGWLHSVAELNDLGRTILSNIAPAAPDAVLTAFEDALVESKNQDKMRELSGYVPLFRSLAYDEKLFERCIALILRIAAAQDIGEGSNEASKAFGSLFSIHFSGTHATIEQRLSVIEALSRSNDPKKRALGLIALKAMLKTSNFGPALSFQFGARSRNFGYWPRTTAEVKCWFGETLKLAETLACGDGPLATQVLAAIADKFRGLWNVECIHDDLERLCQAIAKRQFWADGWIAVRETTFYDSEGFSPEVSAQLVALETLLRPTGLAQKVRSIVLSEEMIFVGLDSVYDATDGVGKPMAQVEETARELGKATAVDQNTFAELLPELLTGNSQQLWNFGRGLAEGSEEPHVTWDQMVRCFATIPTNSQRPNLFRGFSVALRATDAKLLNFLLDDALANEALAEWYPVLQAAAGIDKQGVNRLMHSLQLGKASIGMYRQLVAGGVTHSILGTDFNNLLLRIAARAEGLDIAIEILAMRLSSEDGRRQSSDSEIIDIGCELLRQLKFTGRRGVGLEWRLQIIATLCLAGEKGAAAVREICRNLREAISRSETYPFNHNGLLRVLLRAQPFAALEALCGDDARGPDAGISILDQADLLRTPLLDAAPEADLLDWCDQQPQTRYPLAAGLVAAFRPSDNAGRPQWTSIARSLMDKAPNRVEVLKKFVGQFSPTGWAGSEATIVETNAKLLDEFVEYPDPAVRQFVAAEKTRLADSVGTIRRVEMLLDRQQNETFE
jgi:hypothetical protein